MSYFNPEIVPNNLCQCYKKLEFLGVPLYKTEEDDEYGEGQGHIPNEGCFQLPRVLTINSQIIEYPVVDENKLPVIFRQMAQVIPNLSDFELNNLSFWILDMFIEGLWTAQKAGMNHDHQRATLLWIAYLFNYIQKENPSRKELFLHLKMILFTPDFKRNEYSEEETREELFSESINFAKERLNDGSVATNPFICGLLLPPGTMGTTTESYLSPTEELSLSDDPDLPEVNGEDVKSTSTPTTIAGEETVCEKNLRHMKIILEILYRIFARLWVFLEIQAVFHVMPNVEQVDLPFKLNMPKPVAKTDLFPAPKGERPGRKMSASEGLTEEMEMEKQFRKNDYILPLQAAEESKVYIKQVFAQPPSDRSIYSKGKDKKK